MYRTSASRLKALKGRASNRTLARFASSSAVATATKSSSWGGLLGWLTGKSTSSCPPLDVPLKDVSLPPPLPDYVEQGKMRITTLKNGLKIASETSPSPAASIGLFIDSGSIYERPDEFGTTHLLERMAFKSTTNRSHLRIVREMEAIGGNMTSAVSREQMSYTYDALKTYLPQMVELLIDTVRNPIFFDWEVNEQIQKVKLEVSEASKNPNALLLEAIHSAGYTGALANPLMAPESALGRLNATTLEHFVAENFTAPRMVLAASGVDHEELVSKILTDVAVRTELIVVLANTNVKAMLEVQITSIKKSGISNYLVVALDDGIVEFCKSNDVHVYKRDQDGDTDLIAKSGSNHAVSGLKFRILREFLQLGYSVLLSDVDIVYLQNPFHHIYRDSDVESMTDGHNNMTAYGYNDVFDEPAMGWARYAHTMRIWVYNSGLFYIRPTIPSIELLDRVANRLAKEPKSWDQAVFNEELFYPSHPGYNGLHIAKRTMDFYLFMNSKVLFKTVRKDGNLKKLKPVTIHVNYHPDKLYRMQAIVEFYVDGKQDALEAFPDGSEWETNSNK